MTQAEADQPDQTGTAPLAGSDASPLLPRWRSEPVARDATQLVARLLGLVAALWVAIALVSSAATASGDALAWLRIVGSHGVTGALLAVLTPGLAGLLGALIVSRARLSVAADERLGPLPATTFHTDADRVGRAARLGQALGVTVAALAGLAVTWVLRNPAVLPIGVAAAGTACIGLAILAYPLLIGERLLANKSESDLPEAAALRSLLLLGVVGLPLTGVLLLLSAAGLPQAIYGVHGLAWLGSLVTAELAVRALMRGFLPRPDENAARAACTSLLATLLADGTHPGGIATSVRRNLGIDFTRSWALSFVRAALGPAALGLAVLTWGLTGLAVVRPDQRVIVEHLGKPTTVLQPGLHVTWPWPFTQLRPLENGVTRETNLSGDGLSAVAVAHADDRAVPEADRLWQQAHSGERLFLIASGDRDGQSFQAMGADIRLIWRIGPTDADALRFTYTTDDPERALVATAGRALADAFASETIDSALGENRAALAAALTRTIQNGADRAELGITLVAVVIEAMHPPTGAAGAFHAVQAAELAAQTAVATEHGTSVATRAQAQTAALETLATAAGNAAETRATALVALTGFEADRTAAAAGGPTFTFERYLTNLTAVASRITLTVLDHRVTGAGAPTIDLRLPGASGSTGQ